MSWIFFALVGYLLNSVAIITDKALLNKREFKNPAVYTILISILGLLVFLLAPWGLEAHSVLAIVYGLCSGVAFTLGLWLMFIVLEQGEASRVPAFIGAFNPLIVFLGSYLLLNERLNQLEMLGFVLLFIGGWMMVSGHGGLTKRQVILALLSSVAFGVAYVLLKRTFINTNFISGLVWSRLGGFVSSLLLFFIPGTYKSLIQSSKPTKSKFTWVLIGGQAIAALGGLLNSYAITLASVTLVNALQGIQYVFLLIFSALISFRWPTLFHDEFNKEVWGPKILATISIVIGLVLLSGGM